MARSATTGRDPAMMELDNMRDVLAEERKKFGPIRDYAAPQLGDRSIHFTDTAGPTTSAPGAGPGAAELWNDALNWIMDTLGVDLQTAQIIAYGAAGAAAWYGWKALT